MSGSEREEFQIYADGKAHDILKCRGLEADMNGQEMQLGETTFALHNSDSGPD